MARDVSAVDLSEPVARLHAYTQRGDGCWLFTGRRVKGYGVVVVGGRDFPAHRLALIAAGVSVPLDLEACHYCHNRACVNPAHLYVASHRQNLLDTVSAGRNNPPAGERHGHAKLTEADVARIRARRATGERLRSLAWTFGVGEPAISRICRGLSWKGVA